jgi:hypothetical protein
VSGTTSPDAYFRTASFELRYRDKQQQWQPTIVRSASTLVRLPNCLPN